MVKEDTLQYQRPVLYILYPVLRNNHINPDKKNLKLTTNVVPRRNSHNLLNVAVSDHSRDLLHRSAAWSYAPESGI